MILTFTRLIQIDIIIESQMAMQIHNYLFYTKILHKKFEV